MEREGLSIILPCYNQAHVLTSTLASIRSFFESRHIPYEIIAVNDGSTDETASLLKREQELGVRVYTHMKNLGKGRAVKTGILAARYPLSLFLDADLAIPIEEVEKFFAVLRERPEISGVIASRFVQGHTTVIPVLRHRKIMENVFRLLRKGIIGLSQIEDTQCGFKMFRTDRAKALFQHLTCNRFSFDAELLFIANRWKLTVKELPVALQNPQRSSIRIGTDSLRMFLDLFRIRWQAWCGWYQKVESYPATITLDDCGISELVNDRICEVASHSQVARIAVMSRGLLPDSVRTTLLASGKKLDIHLELPVELGERVVHGSFFRRVFCFLSLVARGELASKKVEASWRAQIEKFQQLFGRLPDGINSHEHTHFFPFFFKITLRLSQEYNIPFIRQGRKIGPLLHPVAALLALLRVMNRLFVGKPRATTETLVSFDWGVSPKQYTEKNSEMLYHVERDEEWVYLEVDLWSMRKGRENVY